MPLYHPRVLFKPASELVGLSLRFCISDELLLMLQECGAYIKASVETSRLGQAAELP